MCDAHTFDLQAHPKITGSGRLGTQGGLALERQRPSGWCGLAIGKSFMTMDQLLRELL